MKPLHLHLLSILLLTTLYSQAQSISKDKPNIILMVADDLGWKDVGYSGSKFYKTPNIDALAREGLIFTNGYAAAANCAPSRACLFSGQNTPRHGVYTVGTSERGRSQSRKLIPIENKDFLQDTVFTLSDALKLAGYHTINIGKWHIGENPLSQGFDQNIGGSSKGHPASYFSPYDNPALTDGRPGEYITDRLGDEAVNYLKSRTDGEPFFMYLPFFAVHTPLQAQEELKAKYLNTGTSGQNNATYAAMVESMDANVGKILSALKNMNLDKNTIIIFTSDNGGIASISSQQPTRAGKGSYYEGGIRVPLTVRWPGIVKEGTSTDIPVTNLDFFPTILDIISADTRELILDGNSILPVLKGGKIAKRALYWHFPIYLQAYDPADEARDPVFRTRPGSVIRKGKWKLHVFYEDNGQELYNLKSDLGERVNLLDQKPSKARKLYRKLLDWQEATNAPVPTKLNPEFVQAQQFIPEKKGKAKADN